MNWLARERNISNELEEKLRKLEDPNFENIVEILKNDLPGFGLICNSFTYII